MRSLSDVRERIRDRAVARSWLFVVASLGIHAGLLLALGIPPERNVSALPARELSITLTFVEPAASRIPIRASTPPPAHLRKEAPTRRPAAPTRAEPHPEERVAAAAVANPDTAAVAAVAGESGDTGPAAGGSSEATTRPAMPDPDGASAQIRSLLLADLARRFTYPILARRLGYQGRVLLSVTIKPSGLLEHVQIAQSSGYDVLDRAAVNSMRRIGRVVNPIDGSYRREWRLLLPIVYRLTD